MVMRFVIGRTADDSQEAELMTECREHGGFLRLDLEVRLHNSHPATCVSSAAASVIP